MSESEDSALFYTHFSNFHPNMPVTSSNVENLPCNYSECTQRPPDKNVWYINGNMQYDDLMNRREIVNRKVLINPHFKTQVYINPHFEKNAQLVKQNNRQDLHDIKGSQVYINPHFERKTQLTPKDNAIVECNDVKNSTIHINPKMLNSLTTQTQTTSATIHNNNNINHYVHSKLNTNSNQVINSETQIIHSSPHKLIKCSQKSLNKPQIVLSTAHKLIKSSSHKSPRHITHLSSYKQIKYAQKLSKQNIKSSIIHLSPHKLIKCAPVLSQQNLKSPSIIIKSTKLTNNYTTIKLSPNKLVKIKHNAFLMTPKISASIKTINTSTHKIDRRKKVLIKTSPKRKLSNSIISEFKLDRRIKAIQKTKNFNICDKISYKIDRRTSANKLVKKQLSSIEKYKWLKTPATTVTGNRMRSMSNSQNKASRIISRTRILSTSNFNTPKRVLSQMRQKSINTLSNKLRKNNQPCPFFNRFGKCRGKESGTCKRMHDPKKVTICSKFLKGECDFKDCCLSHLISLEKMPTCKFFLEGFCSRENCPYLHVKLNEKVEVCKNFLEGYCPLAGKCNKRHVLICPEFERNGECKKRFCSYPHKKHNLTKEIKTLTNTNKVKKNTASSEFFIDTGNEKEEVVLNTKRNERYHMESNTNDVDASVELVVAKRPRTEDLPDFIALKD